MSGLSSPRKRAFLWWYRRYLVGAFLGSAITAAWAFPLLPLSAALGGVVGGAVVSLSLGAAIGILVMR